jgi:hypothetical protein
MVTKWVNYSTPFYRLGRYYEPGQPFEIAEGTTPPPGSEVFSGGEMPTPGEGQAQVPFSMSDRPKARKTSDT